MEKWEKYEYSDPFPDIEPALLNSADIKDYANATGMITPFDDTKLKSASYAASIKGVCKYWDDNGNLHEVKLENSNDIFELKPNSIAFVEIEPEFRLPRYIALRFNLKITNVYRGLLLGTGPLIDPGYHGKIYIPLHNLTSNTYKLKGGDDLIWIEFTKTSKIKEDENKQGKSIARTGSYVPFTKEKRNQKLEYFLNKANNGAPIRNSIAQAVESSRKSALSSEEDAKRAKETIQTFGWLGLMGIAIGIVTIVLPVYQMQTSYVLKLTELGENISKTSTSLDHQVKYTTDWKTKYTTLEENLKQQTNAIKTTNGKLEQIRSSYDNTSINNSLLEMRKMIGENQKALSLLAEEIKS